MTTTPLVTLNDGRTMPQIGLGVFKVPPPEAQALVETALAVGYDAVDTAAFYANEAGVGAGVRSVDRPIFVTTKLWRADMGYDKALAAFDRSFETLGLDWVDLFLIHWPEPHTDLYVQSWRALIRLRDEGRVKSIGVSNFQANHLERMIHDTGVTPAVNQVECNPAFQQVELRAFNEESGIATTSWAPLGQGRLLDDLVIARIAEKHGRTAAQIIIRWHLDSGLIIIPKASSEARLRENLAATEFVLDDEDMAAIAGLDDPDGRAGPDPDRTEGLNPKPF